MGQAVKAASAVALATTLLWANAGAEPVDLLLVLAADVSRSVDDQKFRLQRDGYAAAIADPRVLLVIRSGSRGRIGICFVEWSDGDSQNVVADWTVLLDAESAQKLSERIREAPRSFRNRTSISGAINFAVAQLERAPHESTRRTIDLSGDGANNSGDNIHLARDRAIAKEITINGLVIFTDRPYEPWNSEHDNPPGGIDKYYRLNVIGGPGAFVMAAEAFESFGEAIIHKLVAEIATGDDQAIRVAAE